jgi:hypothetical protein
LELCQQTRKEAASPLAPSGRHRRHPWVKRKERGWIWVRGPEWPPAVRLLSLLKRETRERGNVRIRIYFRNCNTLFSKGTNTHTRYKTIINILGQLGIASSMFISISINP